VKIRIGYGLGVRTQLNDHQFLDVVEAMESLRFDSLWVSERVGSECPDPVVAMSMAAARTTKLKFGMSVMVLPGRNPVLLAKQLATLDRMSQGRLLPAFGLGVADPAEQQAFGVERSSRARLFDESLEVIRKCWTQETVTHQGEHFTYDDLRVLPKPLQKAPDVWLGGIAPSELKRVARLSDGWLPSFVTPSDDEHFGVLIPYTMGPLPEPLVAGLRARRPDLDDVSVLIPTGWEGLVSSIREFVAVGASKFVVLPIVEPTDARAWITHLEDASRFLLPLQT
jgi:alkanesulfonate monooxygenase SsuD/methylene tetrahydromethanopterin reductase-like flavin-dependent oxidoreductase (luciferase family)